MSYTMNDDNLREVLKDNIALRMERQNDERRVAMQNDMAKGMGLAYNEHPINIEPTSEEVLAEIRRRKFEIDQRKVSNRLRRSMPHNFERELREMRDPNTPDWCMWQAVYGKVATLLIRAESRGFFQLRERDRNLCNQITKEERITDKQRRWLGFLSGKHLQDGVYEGHTWWTADPKRNLVVRWDAILDASTDKNVTVEQLEEVTGSEFMARYQKVLTTKV